MADILVVDRLTKRFGGVAAVEECSLAVAEGSITAVIGPNGAGKSTLFNLVAGALAPDSGRIRLDDVDVTGLKPHQLFAQGLVRTFQVPQTYQRLPVIESLMVVPAGQRGERLSAVWLRPALVRRQEAEIRARAEAVLDFLRLRALAQAPAGSLSGGQKKLLEIGRTMMAEPKLVLLDEPGAGVNPSLLAEIGHAIERLNRERGYTVCIIEHNMDLIARLCDPVIVMAEGRILTQGTMAEVRADPRVIEAYLGSAAHRPAAAVR